MGSSPSSSSSLSPSSFSSCSSGSRPEDVKSGGRMMPSARRYEMNEAERGMRRALGIRERYLPDQCVNFQCVAGLIL